MVFTGRILKVGFTKGFTMVFTKRIFTVAFTEKTFTLVFTEKIFTVAFAVDFLLKIITTKFIGTAGCRFAKG